MSRRRKPYPAKVTWKDAHAMYGTWSDAHHPEEDDDYIVETVGWVLPNRKKGHTVVALNLSPDHVGDGIAIPDGMIVEISPLK